MDFFQNVGVGISWDPNLSFLVAADCYPFWIESMREVNDFFFKDGIAKGVLGNV